MFLTGLVRSGLMNPLPTTDITKVYSVNTDSASELLSQGVKKLRSIEREMKRSAGLVVTLPHMVDDDLIASLSSES